MICTGIPHLSKTATPVKTLTGEVNYIDHLVTVAVCYWESPVHYIHLMTLDTKDSPKHHCRSSSSHECQFLTAMALPSRTLIPARKKKSAMEWPEDPNKELKALTWPQNSRDPNLYKHLWMCWNKLSIEAPICKPKDPEKLVLNTKGHPQRSCIHASAAQSPIHGGTPANCTCSIGLGSGEFRGQVNAWSTQEWQFMTNFCYLMLCIVRLRGYRAGSAIANSVWVSVPH